MKTRIRIVLFAVALGWLSAAAETSHAALAKAAGGAGYSGKLSSNKVIRKQQLICDPAEGESSGAAEAGSTSVTYDPHIVSLSGVSGGPGYSVATGAVAVSTECGVILQEIQSFLNHPLGSEVGYVQVDYVQSFTEYPGLTASNVPGQMSPPAGYTLVDQDGPVGFDTHSLSFDYLEGVAETRVAAYTLFAAKANEFFGNVADYLTAVDADGQRFTLKPDQISSATVSGSLVKSVPLPPGAWAGAGMLAGLAGFQTLRRRAAGAAC